MEEMKENFELGEDWEAVPAWASKVALLRKQYWKLQQAREEEDHCSENKDFTKKKQPVTCFLYPGLTPNKLREHLIDQGASDPCILEWMRRLQEFRQKHSETQTTGSQPELDKSYAVKLLGK